MMARDELLKLFRLMSRNRDPIIDAYLEHAQVIDESDLSENAIEGMLRSSLAFRREAGGDVIVSPELTTLFDRALRDPRRTAIDADVAATLIKIQENVYSYRQALASSGLDDAEYYITQVERLVDDLVRGLQDRSSQLWQKISSEFGYVSNLELKIKENEIVLEQARRLNDSIGLIKIPELEALAGGDPRLRRTFHRYLARSLEACRLEAVDAHHKLAKLLFEFRRQQRMGRLIDRFFDRYQSEPGYEPDNYADTTRIAPVLNAMSPLALAAHADLTDPICERHLVDIIIGLRKEKLEAEDQGQVATIGVEDEPPPVELEMTPLRAAVEEFFVDAGASGEPISAIEYYPGEAIEPDPSLWVFAVMARYNLMEREDRAAFDLKFVEVIDDTFDGVRLVQDVTVRYVAQVQAA